MNCMDETAARRLQAAEEIVEADRAQAEAQQMKPGRLTHDDVRAIVREEFEQALKPTRRGQAEAIDTIGAPTSDVREVMSAVSGLRELLDGLGEVLHGFRQLPISVFTGMLAGATCGTLRGACVADGTRVRHDASPSVVDLGDYTVGDGQAAGGELSPSAEPPESLEDEFSRLTTALYRAEAAGPAEFSEATAAGAELALRYYTIGADRERVRIAILRRREAEASTS